MNEELLFNIFLDLSFIALAIAYAISKERSLPKSLKQLGFRQIKAIALAKKTAILALALLGASIGLNIALSFFNLNDLQLVAESVAESQAIAPMFFWFIMLRVISEEIFFRGLLTTKLGALGSSIIFAGFHIGYLSIAEIIGAFALGYILAKAFELNKNLYPNILAHALYNAIVLSAMMG